MSAFSILQHTISERQKLVQQYVCEMESIRQRRIKLETLIEAEKADIEDLERTLRFLSGNIFPGKSLNGVDVIAAKIRAIKDETGAVPDHFDVTAEEMRGYRAYFITRGFNIPKEGEPMHCEGVLLRVMPELPHETVERTKVEHMGDRLPI